MVTKKNKNSCLLKTLYVLSIIFYVLGIIYGIYQMVKVFIPTKDYLYGTSDFVNRILTVFVYSRFGTSPFVVFELLTRELFKYNLFISLLVLFIGGVLYLFPLLGIISSIIGFLNVRYYREVIHNTIMVVAVLCFNPFIMLAGLFINLRKIKDNKVYPDNR